LRYARSFLISFLSAAISLGTARGARAQKPRLHIEVHNGKITLDAKHVDLYTVLRALSVKTEKNIILNPGIKGEMDVDVFLRDVTLMQAVQAIAWQQGLAVVAYDPLRVGPAGGVLSAPQEGDRESPPPP
jgi:ferric-dicitrate binding protein FerR (iron transport regulator)